jgi:hypothetical protein
MCTLMKLHGSDFLKRGTVPRYIMCVLIHESDLFLYISMFCASFVIPYVFTYLGYLVVDLRWSRWVLSGDVVGQCCLRSYLSSV